MLLFCLKLTLERDYQLLIPCKNLVASGDKVNKIQAVSGVWTLFLYNFDENNLFDIVKKLVYKVYRPDPKIDLSGIDVARRRY
jgi:aspartokinase/homoserine dehydrogenase 1